MNPNNQIINESTKSIFNRYYSSEVFIDRYMIDPKDAVDVIIPVIHTNELWESNLKSIYREIPVKRLLVGDGGCIDDSIEIANKYPRVKVFNQKDYVSLGFSIRKLIENVRLNGLYICIQMFICLMVGSIK